MEDTLIEFTLKLRRATREDILTPGKKPRVRRDRLFFTPGGKNNFMPFMINDHTSRVGFKNLLKAGLIYVTDDEKISALYKTQKQENKDENQTESETA